MIRLLPFKTIQSREELPPTLPRHHKTHSFDRFQVHDPPYYVETRTRMGTVSRPDRCIHSVRFTGSHRRFDVKLPSVGLCLVRRFGHTKECVSMMGELPVSLGYSANTKASTAKIPD